ncbi:MAG: DsbA family protein [Limnobacter sp.]|nr:DsbA family protein [Limnobacter sp.]
MSVKTLLMPYVTQKLFSRDTLLAKRKKAEKARQSAGRPHVVHYFHQVDDPYSALMVQVLPELAARYSIELKAHVVSPPPDSAAPEREKLVEYSRKDAQALAVYRSLQFTDPGNQPVETKLQMAIDALVSAALQNRFFEFAPCISKWLWQKDSTNALPDNCQSIEPCSLSQMKAHIQQSDQLRENMGHYLGAMLSYEGEWYWGIDRLYHLEERLQDLSIQKQGITGSLFEPDQDLTAPLSLHNPPDIDFFFSFRSPYSAIVAPRVFKLGELTGAKVNLKFVLPMVMRGLAVPKAKREYIVHDTAREAHARGTPFGKLNDPVGRPAERGLSLVPYAEKHGLGQEFVLSFMKGVWSEGIHAGSDSGLKKIVERTGLSWQGALQALDDESWRLRAEANRNELFGLGLWGVPSFRVGTTEVWGQDRLWQVLDALKAQSNTRRTA